MQFPDFLQWGNDGIRKVSNQHRCVRPPSGVVVKQRPPEEEEQHNNNGERQLLLYSSMDIYICCCWMNNNNNNKIVEVVRCWSMYVWLAPHKHHWMINPRTFSSARDNRYFTLRQLHNLIVLRRFFEPPNNVIDRQVRMHRTLRSPLGGRTQMILSQRPFSHTLLLTSLHTSSLATLFHLHFLFIISTSYYSSSESLEVCWLRYTLV